MTFAKKPVFSLICIAFVLFFGMLSCQQDKEFFVFSLSLESDSEYSGDLMGQGYHKSGFEVTVKARAADDHLFLFWVNEKGDIVSTEPEYSFVMPSHDITLSGVFNRIQGTVEDIDGNIYSTVKMGRKEWMSENLRVRRFNNADSIPTDWDGNTGAYAIYDHQMIDGLDSETEMVNIYGLLYNGHAVADERGLCPVGWKVPTTRDWARLEFYSCNVLGNLNCNKIFPPEYDCGWLGSYEGQGLKTCRQPNHPNGDCTTDLHPRWDSSNKYGTDAFGFSVLPGGIREGDGDFVGLDTRGEFWTQSSPNHLQDFWIRTFSYQENKIGTWHQERSYGLSVRCIKE